MKKARFINVKLREIFGPSPEISELMPSLAGSFHAWCIENFSDSSTEALVALHPILVQESEKQGYHVIGGFRTYQLVIAHLAPHKLVRVLLYPRLESEQIRHLAATDILGSPLLLGLGSKPQKQVERLCESLPSSELESIHPELSSLRGIRRLLRGGGHA